jgi:hypothetical protein
MDIEKNEFRDRGLSTAISAAEMFGLCKTLSRKYFDDFS